jgi:hypothetical protein
MRQLLSFFNQRKFYYRKDDFSGKTIISLYQAETSFPVIYITDWIAKTGWDPTDYAVDYDFSRPFFEQWKDFSALIPRFNMYVVPESMENAEYNNNSEFLKDCYLVTEGWESQNCFYSNGLEHCTDCAECYRALKCTLCYECVFIKNCHNCKYLQYSNECSNCFFGYDLHNCSNCFGCFGLRNKEYCLFNEQLTKEEWKLKVNSLTMSCDTIDHILQKFDLFTKDIPRIYSRLLQCENVSGDNLYNSQFCEDCFDGHNLQDCVNCVEITQGAVDSIDYAFWGDGAEKICGCISAGANAQSILFSSHCWANINNLIYCHYCHDGVYDCFGCFGLRQAQYCIFNKQYTKEEYQELVPKIIKHMQNTGEWGHFFPAQLSSFTYQDSLANDYFPLTKDKALNLQFNWKDQYSEHSQYLGSNYPIPECIEDVSDDITKAVLLCSITGQPFKITLQELKLYRKLDQPIPLKCPTQRHLDRIILRNPRKLWDRKCAKCSKAISTSYAPDRPEVVYCEACYLSEVY